MPGPVDAGGPQQAGEHRLAAEHIQRQVAVVIVVAVELRAFLIAVQWHIGGIDVEDQFARHLPLRGDELLDQHLVQGHDIGPCRARFQPREGRRAGQFLDFAHRRLHQRIMAQYVVIVQVLIAAAQPVQPLGNQVAQRMGDPFRIARVAQRSGDRCRQADLPINLPYQQQTPVGTERTTREIRFDRAAPNAPKQHLLTGTIWHRRNSSQYGFDTCIRAPFGRSADTCS